jgi:hypothetical protein
MNYLLTRPIRAVISVQAVLALALAVLVPAGVSAQSAGIESRSFPDSGYSVRDDTIWTFFSLHGRSAIIGKPISREFALEGTAVQLFEQAALQVRNDGVVQVMPLTGPGLLPYTHLAGLTVPPTDAALTIVAPSPDQFDSPRRTLEFVRSTVPETWNGQAVHFFSTVTTDGLDIWGVPTSRPTADPHNPNFVYQRFQNGILLFDAASGTTSGLPVGGYLKAVLTGENLPADLALDAAQSPLLRQYDPSKPFGLASPALLSATDLTDAFTPDAE